MRPARSTVISWPAWQALLATIYLGAGNTDLEALITIVFNADFAGWFAESGVDQFVSAVTASRGANDAVVACGRRKNEQNFPLLAASAADSQLAAGVFTGFDGNMRWCRGSLGHCLREVEPLIILVITSRHHGHEND
ncbi:hypothetical protein JCM12296A_28290 [Desulfosarcina cetonica]